MFSFASQDVFLHIQAALLAKPPPKTLDDSIMNTFQASAGPVHIGIDVWCKDFPAGLLISDDQIAD